MTTATASAGAAALPRGRMLWPGVLVTLGAGSAVLTIWGSWAASRSDYYAAIALSMSRSWPNFLFGAMDPAGTVTLDKIPGSFWIPALFVKAFGFSTLAVVLPNALAAVAAVLLVAVTARRMGGVLAGTVAGAVTATTPIFVAVARSNQPEMFFVLALALVAWAATRALEHASLAWLVVAGAFIAAAFQCYMLEAWAVWPALAAAYLCTRVPLRRRVAHLSIAGLTSAALSVAWIVVVWLVPPGARPYIGSTLHNSAWEMVFGYNGLGRFGGATADSAAYNSFTPPYSGSPGPLRFFQLPLAGQVAWLIPTALLALVILIVLRLPARTWVFLGGWLVTLLVMFSAVAGMHQFYTAALAVPLGLLVGTAFAWTRRRGMLWPAIALVSLTWLVAIGIAVGYGGYSVRFALVQLVLAATAVAAACTTHRARKRRGPVVPALAIAALLLTPAAWSVVTIWHPSSVNPVAGGVSDSAGAAGAVPIGPGSAAQQPIGPTPAAPSTTAPGEGAAVVGGTGTHRTKAVLEYVETHAHGARYLVAVFGAQTAASMIVASGGGSILPIGGFDGGDPVPALGAFTAMARAGDIPYVLTSNGGRGGFFAPASTTSTQIREWVTAHCTAVADGEAPLSGLYRCGAP